MQRTVNFYLVIFSGLAVLSTPLISQAEYEVTGLKPCERPAEAPVITEYKKDDNWYQRAMYGVSTPYPSSLKFLEDQGAWYTPFSRPGVPGHYDIRDWH